MITFQVEVAEQTLASAIEHAKLHWPGEPLPVHRFMAVELGKLLEPLDVDKDSAALSVTVPRVHVEGDPVQLKVTVKLAVEDEQRLPGRVHGAGKTVRKEHRR